MSKSINKIRERNLDEELLNRLFFKDQKISFDNLSASVVSAIKSGTNAKTAYNDEELRNRIASLESSRITIASADEKYVSKATHIPTNNEISTEISAKFKEWEKKVADVLNKKVNLANGVIDESMLTPELKYKVNARYNNLYNNNSGNEIANDLSELTFQINKNTESLGRLDDYVTKHTVKKEDEITEEQLDGNIRAKLNKDTVPDGSLTLAAFNTEDREKLLKAINSDASLLSGRIAALEGKLSGEKGNVLYATEQGTAFQTLFASEVYATEDVDIYQSLRTAILAKPMSNTVSTDRITLDLSEYSHIVCLDESMLDTDTFLEKKERSSTEDDGSTVFMWEESEETISQRFSGQLLKDDVNDILFFLDPRGSVYRLVVGANAPVDVRYKEITCEIPPVGSYTFPLKNVRMRIHKILVLDTEVDSRSLNKYINAEGVVTAAYEDDEAVLYNDTNKEISVKVLYS